VWAERDGSGSSQRWWVQVLSARSRSDGLVLLRWVTLGVAAVPALIWRRATPSMVV